MIFANVTDEDLDTLAAAGRQGVIYIPAEEEDVD